MNHLQKHFSASLIALAALLSAAPMAWAATTLGSASTYAALAGGPAGGAVTCTDSVATSTVTVTGDVGVVLPGTFTNSSCTISGTVNTNATGAYADFLSAYATLKSTSTPCTTTFAEDAAGGNTFTGNVPAIGPLAPGVYCFHKAVTFTGTTLTLNGSSTDTWIFKVGIDGTGALTSTDSSVVMTGGGVLPSCNLPNVYWWVAQAATIKRGDFQGTILAGADITMTGVVNAPSTFNGDALAGGAGSTSVPTGAVTLTDMNVNSCAGTVISPPPPSCDTDNNDGKGKDGDCKDKDGDGHDKDKHHHDKDKDHKDDSHHSFKDGGNPFDKDGRGDKK